MAVPDAVDIYGLSTHDYKNIKQAYGMLWNFFTNIPNLSVKGDANEFDINHKNGKVTVESDRIFIIKGVGFEAGRSTGPIDICFEPDLTIIGAEYKGKKERVIESSATAVSYLQVEERDANNAASKKHPATILSAFHYDFEMDTKDRHPIFHTQYEPSSIELGKFREYYDIQNKDQLQDSVPNHPRVPTAPLDFAGVLCVLIHEHVEEFTSAWPMGTIKAVGQLPTFPSWAFEPNPLCNGALVPEWWYFAARNQTVFPENIIEARASKNP